MEQDWLNDPDLVIFEGKEPPLKPGEVEEHAFGIEKITDRLFGRRIEEVKADWQRVSGQIQQMLQAIASVAAENFAMDTVEISLGFSAQGKLVFIAEAGVEATVSVTYKRLK